MNPSYKPHNSLVSAFSRDILRNPYQGPQYNYGGVVTNKELPNATNVLTNAVTEKLPTANSKLTNFRIDSFFDIIRGHDMYKKLLLYSLLAITAILILFLLINAKTKNKKFQIGIYVFLMLYLIFYVLLAPTQTSNLSFETVINKILVVVLLLYVFPSPIFTAHKSDDPWADTFCGILLLVYLTFFATGIFNTLLGDFKINSYLELYKVPLYLLSIVVLIGLPTIIYFFKKISKK
jgi:hypothetical protein